VTRPFYFVMLNPSLDALRGRNASRAKRDVFQQAEHLYPVVQWHTQRIGLWLDTSALSEAQTVERIYASLSQARID